MTKYRIETDSMGDVNVPEDKYYGAQTQRSLENFKIGHRLIPDGQIKALVQIKKVCALANLQCHKISEKQSEYITKACDDILLGKLDEHFVLNVFQTGSGTQSNMNVNEVISHYANILAGENIVHPNDHVNASQSSNDVFPSAMHVATHQAITSKLLPSLNKIIEHLDDFAKKHSKTMKVGRTHLQDATNLTVGQQFSGYVAGLKTNYQMIEQSLLFIEDLALGGTAVGTGINTPENFIEELAKVVPKPFKVQNNKFEQLSLKSGLAHVSASLRNLSMTLFKIANDIRFLASGPRLGYGELQLKSNEPGSSIMPGKVNPTQCESMMMVCLAVVGNDQVIGLADGQGNFELNVMMPLIIDKLLESITLLSDSMDSFVDHLLDGLQVNNEQLASNVERNLMSATALNPFIGYDKVSKIVKICYENNRTIKEVGIELGYFSGDEYEGWIKNE